MADNSCCSCVFSKYEVNETDDGNYVICSKGIDITAEMLMDKPCEKYIKNTIR